MHLNWKASRGTEKVKEQQDKRKRWGRRARLDVKTDTFKARTQSQSA